MDETRGTCPRCRSELRAAEVYEVGARFLVGKCEHCGGQFFQAGDLAKIEDAVEPRLLEIRRLPPGRDQRASLECPVCPAKTWMTKVEHQRDRKVLMDVCPECRGTWLDGGELEAIRQESLAVFVVNTLRWFADVVRSDRET